MMMMMHGSRITRKIDTLGRIVLPIDMRKSLNLHPGSEVELFFEKDQLILRKPQEICRICGSFEDLMKINDLSVCVNCAKKVKDLVSDK